jgi:hypothetical protein
LPGFKALLGAAFSDAVVIVKGRILGATAKLFIECSQRTANWGARAAPLSNWDRQDRKYKIMFPITWTF